MGAPTPPLAMPLASVIDALAPSTQETEILVPSQFYSAMWFAEKVSSAGLLTSAWSKKCSNLHSVW